MKLVLFLALLTMVSCGDGKQAKENPTNCALKEVEGGTEFTCTDKDGNVTVGVVKDGAPGAQGEKGEKGEPGKGLAVASTLICNGSVEAWMENASYEVAVRVSIFETGDKFLAMNTKLMRGEEMINMRSGAAFYLNEMPAEVSDGVLKVVIMGDYAEVSSRGGVSAKISCVEQGA